MIRRLLGATAASAVAVGALVALGPAAPASADGTYAPWAGLAYHPEWGTLTGTNTVLGKGCKNYSFSYTITPPEGYWAMEYVITGPNGTTVAAGGFLDGSDPLSGTENYTLCQPTATVGTYTMSGKVSVENGAVDATEGRIAETTFTLTATPPKKKHRHHHKPHHRPHHGPHHHHH